MRDVASQTDDRHPSIQAALFHPFSLPIVLRSYPYALADGIRTRPIAPGKALVHNSDTGVFCAPILCIEIAAGHQFNSHGFEVVWKYPIALIFRWISVSRLFS
jgi:hypothetical protein